MLNRFRAFVADTFAISHREATGVFVLLLILLLCVLSPIVWYRFPPVPVENTTATDQAKLDSMVASMKTQGLTIEKNRYPDRPGREDRHGNETHTAERFHEPNLAPFDPNTISVAGWQNLGLPRWMAERIDKYRSKGGVFRKKEDLRRIYDFPPDVYAQLEPYITLPAAAPRYADRAAPATPPPPGAAALPTPPPADRPRYVARPAPQPFDINTADTTQLIALKGIGSKLADRIIRYRNDLGGFLNQEQFRDIYGLDSISLAQLTLFAKVQSGVRRVPVNTASAADLDRLPFLSRRQAEVIVNYRNQHGAFQGMDALKAVRVLNEPTLAQLAPYLSF